MTAEEFKKNFEGRYVSYSYDVDTHSVVSGHLYEGIYQCLKNQEEILRRLNDIKKV